MRFPASTTKLQYDVVPLRSVALRLYTNLIPHGYAGTRMLSFWTADIWGGSTDGDSGMFPIEDSLNGLAAYGGG